MNLTLKTDRLLLRPLAEIDVDLCLELYTDPDVMKYVRPPSSREDVLKKMPVLCQRGGAGCIGVWCLIDQVTGEKHGTSVLLPMPIDEDEINWSLVHGTELPDGEVEVSYILKPLAWGKGYATEACSRLIRFAFEDTPLQEIVAVTDPDNSASQHVLTKCGLVHEGNRRAYNENVPGFRISKTDWSTCE